MQQVGRYRLTRRLGQGGMAEVFEAVAEGEGGFRRRVALKRVLPQLSEDASIARMFLDEARTTSHLHHGNIVSVLDYGTADGSAFQVLEYVEGLDLDQLLRRADERRTPLPLGLAIHLVVQVARALDYAHNAKDEAGVALGIVHRDVSPSNVLVSWDGHIKLSDFGIALAANRLERTEGASVKGKLEYMSPEQALRGHVDRRSDVFALGCMLQRLITGKSPLGELSALARMASGEELVLDPTLDAQVREVVARATRHAQTQRYASAADLSRALSALLPTYLKEEATLALQRWLSALRDEGVVEKKRGALDALLNVELVLSPPDSLTQERSFATRTPVASPASVPTPQDAALLSSPANVELAAQAATRTGPQKRTSVWPGLSAFAVIALLVGAFYVGNGFSATQSRPPPPLPRSTAARVAPTQPTVDKVKVIDEPNPTVAVTDVIDRAERGGTRRPRARTESPSLPKTVEVAPPVPPAGLGTLVIGGDGALRAEIRIDGRAVGFAPKRVELSTGSHEIVLVRPDGTLLGPHNVRIDRQHTASAPAKWIVN